MLHSDVTLMYHGRAVGGFSWTQVDRTQGSKDLTNRILGPKYH